METAFFEIVCDRLRSYGNQPLDIIHVINFYIRDTQQIYTTITIIIIIIISLALFTNVIVAKFNHQLRAVISLLELLDDDDDDDDDDDYYYYY